MLRWLFRKKSVVESQKEPIYYENMRGIVFNSAAAEVKSALRTSYYTELDDKADVDIRILVNGEVEKRHASINIRNKNDIGMLMNFDFENEDMINRMGLSGLTLHQFMIRKVCITMYDYTDYGIKKVIRIVS